MGVDLTDARCERIDALLQLLTQIGDFSPLQDRRAREADRTAIEGMGALPERDARHEDTAEQHHDAAYRRTQHKAGGELDADDARRPLPQQRQAHFRGSDGEAQRNTRSAVLDDGIVTPDVLSEASRPRPPEQ
jgi:hypothetical protein